MFPRHLSASRVPLLLYSESVPAAVGVSNPRVGVLRAVLWIANIFLPPDEAVRPILSVVTSLTARIALRYGPGQSAIIVYSWAEREAGRDRY